MSLVKPTVVLAVLCAFIGVASGAGTFSPRIEKATLVVGGKSIAPLAVHDPAIEGARVGRLTLDAKGSKLVARGRLDFDGGRLSPALAKTLRKTRRIVATVSTEQDLQPSMGASTTDHVCRLAWFRQPGAYLATGRSGSHVVVRGDEEVFVPAGGYVLKKEKKVFRFPIAEVDLRSGRENQLILRVPFSGDLPKSTGSFVHIETSGGESWATNGPFLLSVVGLSLDHSHLIVTLRDNSGHGVGLVFPDR